MDRLAIGRIGKRDLDFSVAAFRDSDVGRSGILAGKEDVEVRVADLALMPFNAISV